VGEVISMDEALRRMGLEDNHNNNDMIKDEGISTDSKDESTHYKHTYKKRLKHSIQNSKSQ
jgi:hypothetical protein